VKFITYDLVASANGWGDETEAQQRAALLRFDQAVKAYERHLDRAKPKVPATAWRFFRHGNPENTLHDARLLRLIAGDSPKGRHGSSAGRGRFVAFLNLEFLSHGEDRLYAFEFKGLRRLASALAIRGGERDLGDLYAYELRAAPHGRLAFSFLFATGATIDVECERLGFRVLDVDKVEGLSRNRMQLTRPRERQARTRRQ
jgi:hypothetical protein